MDPTQHYDSRSQQPLAQEQRCLPPIPTALSDLELKAAHNVVSTDLPVDYRLLLLSLADQYIDEARSMSSYIAYEQSGATLQQYHKLIATAFCCFETVLKMSWQGTKPREEPAVRLRYAQCLYEETENYHEAESILSKGISFCDNHRLLDLKYSMQHLMAKIMFKTKPRAAFKHLDNIIAEAVTCEHTSWVYALRFLRISLSLESGSQHDMHSIISQTKAIVELAKFSGDKSVSAIASLTQACIYLQVRTPESAEDAQHAMATTRASLMSLRSEAAPQLNYILAMIDLASSLDPHNEYDASKQKMEFMRQLLDDQQLSSSLRPDGSFDTPLDRTVGGSLTTESGGIFTKNESGHDCLRFTWLQFVDIYALGYILNTTTVYPARNSTPKMLNNTFAATREKYCLQQTSKLDSIADSNERMVFRQRVKCHALVFKTLIACEASQWKEATECLHELHAIVKVTFSSSLNQLSGIATYLDGLVAQATGNFDSALHSYTSLAVTAHHGQGIRGHIETQLSILAMLNTLLILRKPGELTTSQPISGQFIDPPFVTDLMAKLADLLPAPGTRDTLMSTNLHLRSAYELILSLYPCQQSTRKHHLSASLQAARQLKGQPSLLMLCMVWMFEAFYKGIMGQKSLQTAVAAVKLANDGTNPTWMSVTYGILGNAHELEGHTQQMVEAKQNAEAYLESLPGSLGLVQDEGQKNEMECD